MNQELKKQITKSFAVLLSAAILFTVTAPQNFYAVGCNNSNEGSSDDKKIEDGIKSNDLKLFQNLVGDINAQQDDTGDTLLHLAAYYNAKKIARYLIEHGADVNIKNKKGMTPLHYAAKNNSVEVFKLLLENGANDGAKDDESFTPYGIAAEREHTEILNLQNQQRLWWGWDTVFIKRIPSFCGLIDPRKKGLLSDYIKHDNLELFQQQYPIRDINAQQDDSSGDTLLHQAAYYGSEQIARYLIEHGADVNIKNKKDMTPLHYAAKNNKVEVFKLLRKWGATTNIKDKEGKTPYDIAIEREHTEISNLQNQQSSQNTEFPPYLLHRAQLVAERVQNNRSSSESPCAQLVAERLQNNCSSSESPYNRVIPYESDSNPNIPTEATVDDKLFNAIIDRKIRKCEKLIKNGANVNAENKRHRTPLICAVSRNCVDVVKLLLEYGANVNAENRRYGTPLICAVRRNCVDVVKLLLKNGADVNAEDIYRQTPLVHAINRNRVDIVKLLLENGANVNTENKYYTDGAYVQYEASLMGAINRNRVDIIKLLLEHGAKVDRTDNYRSHNPEILKLLEQNREKEKEENINT